MVNAGRAAARQTPPQQFIFFGGKGGVGKTTCSVAAARELTKSRQRVLIVSTDPAHSLGDALKHKLSSKVKRVAGLDAVELDADGALTRWIARHKRGLETIAEHGTYLDSDDIAQLLRLSLPGVDELMGLVELRRLASSKPYTRVVVDTAPTGHTLRLLAMPETLSRIAEIFNDMQAKHRFLAESLGGTYRADSGDAVISELAMEGRELFDTLRDSERARFHWVLLPEALPLEETRDAVAALHEEAIAISDFIVNRVRAAPRGHCSKCSPKVRAEAEVLRQVRKDFSSVRVIPELLPAPVRSAAPKRRATPRHPLEVIAPETCRLLMFAGKGGVGKTTCAASAALLLAERHKRRKILLLSTDPAHSLSDALDLKLSDEERALPGFPALRTREVDAAALFRARRERYIDAIDELFDSLQGGSNLDATYDRAVARDLIDLSPPGLDEIFGILSISDALVPGAGAPTADQVIVDTAPTGHALRLLEMPGKALEWVHTLLAILLKYRKVTGLGRLAPDLLELARQMRQFLDLLRDPQQTCLVAVTRAAELPRLETARLLQSVARMKIPVSGVLVNAVASGECARCRRVAAMEEREIRALAPGHAKVLAPEAAPPPRGIKELLHWGKTWEIR